MLIAVFGASLDTVSRPDRGLPDAPRGTRWYGPYNILLRKRVREDSMFDRRIACRLFPAVLIVTAGMLGGCSMVFPGAGGLSVLAPQPRPLSVNEQVGTKENDSLASVAEFLERTAHYQLAEPPATRHASPNDAPTAAGVARPVASGYVGRKFDQVDSAGGPPGDPSNSAVANAQVAIDDFALERAAPPLPVIQTVSIVVSGQSVAEISDRAEEPATQNTANGPLDAVEPEQSWTVDDVLGRLEAVAAKAGEFETVWPLKLIQIAFHRDQDASQLPVGLPEGTRSIMAAFVRVALVVRGMARDPRRSGRDALLHIDDLRQVLADRADPEVSTVALCRKVLAFGVYDEMSSADFVAGRATPAIVYAEVRNLRAEQMDDGRHRTVLATRIEVLSADGRSLWKLEEPEIVDICRRRRQDFFVAQRITLPSTLPAGEYVLKVMAEDKLSGRLDEASFPFEMTLALSAAGQPGGGSSFP